MKIRFLTKVNENKRFGYVPRYYDERKERLDKMAEKYAESQEVDEFKRKESLRQSIADSWSSSSSIRAKSKKNANVRFLLILAVLALLVYFVFSKGDSINTIVETIE
jgi:hypothetical protein